MKKIQALALACTLGFAGKAQIAGIDPTGAGGFETGADFAANGWTVINPVAAPLNQWVLTNNAPAYSGSLGAHISSDGSSNTYTTTAARTCHFLRDIAVPAGAASINLSFYWKGMGQTGADRLLVYTAPTSVVPAYNLPVSPSTAMAGATLRWTQTTTSASYTLASISLPGSLAGTTVRLIFTWQNDASAGTNPGAAVDNISFNYVCGTPANISGNAPICTGNSVSLSNVFPGGTWSSSNTSVATASSSGTITGISAGSSTITYTVGTCQSTAVVSVNALPAPISGHDTVCVGSTTTFANSVIGGTWMSSYPTVASVLSTSGVITGIVAGGSYITYTMPGGCYVTDTVTVVDLPAAITGALQICPGTSTDLNATPAGGVWSSLNPGSASINAATGIVTGIAADVATIKYASSAGCVVYEVVTINPLPAPIISKNIMCAQGMDTAYNPTPGGTWSSVTPSILSITSGTGYVSPTAGGIGIIKYTLGTSCAITKVMTINPLPTPSISFDGFTNTLSTDTTYESYQWYHSLFGAQPSATIYKTAGLYNGNYYVMVTDTNGCIGTSPMFAYNTNMNTAVGEITGMGNVSIFPNPATDVINISAPVAVSATVSSIEGKTLIAVTDAKRINVSRLPSGFYIISVYNTEGYKLTTERFVKR